MASTLQQAEKLSGWWMQESVEGDITNWLSSEGVGFVMRQAAWAAGYGCKKNRLGLLIADGKVFSEQHMDNAGRFRGRFKIGGEKEKVVVCEGAPLIPTRTAWIEGEWKDGALEMIVWDESKTKKLREAKRSMSEDGNELTTVATMFLTDGSEAVVTTKHSRIEEAPLTLDKCNGWCPVLVSGDMPSIGKPDLLSSLSDSLEAVFPSAAALQESMEQSFKKKELGEGEMAVSYAEVSDSEFTNEVTKADGSKYTLSYQLDGETSTWRVGFLVDGVEYITYYLRIVTDPLRVEGWCILPNGDRVSQPAISAIEDTLGLALKCFLKK
mmetsp:Transcript_22056/g.39544  ORF Transcript_22056/g.39544 Transcript_22056/m.39544 type:complete len:325 (-) Transcript_22056:155-1129(-)|eukprot:CAMPEP_0197650508 /NCGR_PEP_ID=MMETSP1338-20131121/30986_1 /TAXON_ID=43686 ORGANISM="Pelagodinium beii, Strain RCC1491" /NCGR_SAMPLE_ID=MMETSP1338 /ASSEMBLY_ACC=CAM_ASM_000754 /LENGTH=324 /DNA_ID=CAMNT_0043224927 /DNA_START=56 /DNA_END=1030 /DNA_ORIENTATION=-